MASGIQFDFVGKDSIFEKATNSLVSQVKDVAQKFDEIERKKAIADLKSFDKSAVRYFEGLIDYYEKQKKELLNYHEILSRTKGNKRERRKIQKEIMGLVKEYSERQDLLKGDIEQIKGVNVN